MAFNTNTQRKTEANNNQEAWKAQGFLNLYLPSKDGKRVKLGSIPLKESRHNEKQLLDWLGEDPTRAAKLLQTLDIEFKSAEPTAGSGLALPN